MSEKREALEFKHDTQRWKNYEAKRVYNRKRRNKEKMYAKRLLIKQFYAWLAEHPGEEMW